MDVERKFTEAASIFQRYLRRELFLVHTICLSHTYNLFLCAFTCALLQVLERIEDEVPDTPNERLKNLIDEAAALVVSHRRPEAALKKSRHRIHCCTAARSTATTAHLFSSSSSSS